MTDHIIVGVGNPLAFLSAPSYQATILNAGPSVVYHSKLSNVSPVNNEGTLTSGQSLSWPDGERWFVSANSSRLFSSYTPELATDMATQAELDTVAESTGAGLSKAEIEKLIEESASLPSEELVNALIARSGGYLLLTDSRIKSHIDLTGKTASDTGWREALLLANETGADILCPVAGTVKLEKEWVVPKRVGLLTLGQENAFTLNCTKNRSPFYAVNGESYSPASTKLKLEKCNGTPASATPASPQEIFLVNSGLFTYTGSEGEGETITLTGVSGITTTASGTGNHTIAQGCVGYVQPPEAVPSVRLSSGITVKGPQEPAKQLAAPTTTSDGLWHGGGEIDCYIEKCRYPLIITADHQVIGSHVRFGRCRAPICFMGPRMTGGNVVVQAGAYLFGGNWCSIEIAEGGSCTNMVLGDQVKLGQAPWGVWSDEVVNKYGGSAARLLLLVLNNADFEACGNGWIGCPDGKTEFKEIVAYSGSGGQLNYTAKGSNEGPNAPFTGKFPSLTIIGIHGFNQTTAETTAIFLSDSVGSGTEPCRIDELNTFVSKARSAAVPLVKGVEAEHPSVSIVGRGQVALGNTSSDASIAEGHVVQYIGSATKIHRHESSTLAVAGVALMAASQKVVPLATSSYLGPTTVKVKEQSNPPTSPAAAANATAGTLEARTYYAKIVHELSGGGLMAASTEVNATAEASKSIKFTWTNAAEKPHSQTIKATRIYIGTVTNVEEGYVKLEGEGQELIWSGAAKTGVTIPPTKNTGCEIYGKNLVRTNGVAAAGTACVASGPADNTGVVFAQTYEEPDNGETASIMITPALL